jgi:antitoxin HicB
MDGLEGDTAMEKIWFQLVVGADPEDGGYIATTPALPGVAGQGETTDGAARDPVAALQFTLEDMKEDGEPLPESDEDAYNLPLLDGQPHACSNAMVV